MSHNSDEHIDRWGHFRDLAETKLPHGRRVAQYFIVMIDDKDEVYSGGTGVKACIPEMKAVLARYGK